MNDHKDYDGNIKEYQWHRKGKRLAFTCRILSALIMPVLWLVMAALIIIRELYLTMVSFAGLILILLSVLIILIGILVSVNQLFVHLSQRLPPEEKHDFILYRYLYSYQKSERLRNEALLEMAQLDLESSEIKRAEDTLNAIQTEPLSGKNLKIYDLMKIVLAMENEQDSVKDWYIRYAGLSDEKNEFPGNDVVKDWIDQKVDRAEMTEAVSCISLNRNSSAFMPLLFCILAGHCIFFLALLYFPGTGWHLRVNYAVAGGLTTCFFLLVLGGMILSAVIRYERKRVQTTGSKVRLIIGGMAWIVFTVLLSIWIFLTVTAESDDTETILKKDVRDSVNRQKYTYLKVTDDYDTGYYRSPDFMMMEEWDEAGIRDSDRKSPGIPDSTPESTATSSPEDTADPDTASDDGFAAQNAMQRVYEYLKDNSRYGDLSITFNANAKGNLYALIQKNSESDGTSYELRLYDNGAKDDGHEIVLEKVYPDGNSDTELLDFYLVDGQGNVTDEQKTSW